jgi:hypothetical protein
MMMTLWWCGWFVLGSLLSNWFVRTRVVSSKYWYVVDNNVWRRGGERRAEFAKIDEDIAVSEKTGERSRLMNSTTRNTDMQRIARSFLRGGTAAAG